MGVGLYIHFGRFFHNVIGSPCWRNGLGHSIFFTSKDEEKNIFCVSSTGLPDGLFSNQKSRFRKNFEGLTWENVDIFYGHSDLLADILDIL
jgi:hypothetical protein